MDSLLFVLLMSLVIFIGGSLAFMAYEEALDWLMRRRCRKAIAEWARLKYGP